MPDVRPYKAVVAEAEQAARAEDYPRAEVLLLEALRLQDAALGPAHPELASTLNNLAVVSEMAGRLDDAERYYRRAFSIASASLPSTDPLVATSRENLKDFCAAHGKAMEEWPELAEFAPAAAPAPPAAPAPLVPPVAAHEAAWGATPAPRSSNPPAARPASVTAPARPRAVAPPAEAVAMPAGGFGWGTSLVAVFVLAAILGTVLLLRGRRAEPTPAAATSTAPVPQAAPVTPAAPVSEAPAAATASPSAAPAPVAERAAEPPAAVRPAPTAPAATSDATADGATAAGIRVVTADVCAALTTQGAWRCAPLATPAAPGRASYYTRIASPRPLRVQHRWYQGAAVRQSVTLAVGANARDGYRTFSRQTLSSGRWRVELRTAEGTVLHEASFDVP